MTFRTVIKEDAIEQGVYATFKPKPLSGKPGSGMHTHMSLFEGDVNAFYEEGATYQLSQTGRHFIAGLLRHAGRHRLGRYRVSSYGVTWRRYSAHSARLLRRKKSKTPSPSVSATSSESSISEIALSLIHI